MLQYNCFQVDASGVPVGTLPATPKPCGAAAVASGAGLDPPSLDAANPLAEMPGGAPGEPLYRLGSAGLPPSAGLAGTGQLDLASLGYGPGEASSSEREVMISDKKGETGGSTGPLDPPSVEGAPTEDPRSYPARMTSYKVKRDVGGFKLAPIVEGTAYFPCGMDFYSDAEYCCEVGRLIQRSTGAPPAEVSEEGPVPEPPVSDTPSVAEGAPSLLGGTDASTGPDSTEDSVASTGDSGPLKALGSEELASTGGTLYGGPGDDAASSGSPESAGRTPDGTTGAISPPAPEKPVAGGDGAPDSAASGGLAGLTPEEIAYLEEMVAMKPAEGSDDTASSPPLAGPPSDSDAGVPLPPVDKPAR